MKHSESNLLRRRLGLVLVSFFSFVLLPRQATAATPVISVANTSEVEGQAGFTLLAFRVTLSEASSGPVSVKYATTPGTAGVSDFSATSGTLVFAAGQTSRTLLVPIVGDATVEPNETLTMTLSNPVGAALGTSQATGTIVDDDPLGEAVPITLYRLYSPITLEHHYTTDANEYTVLGTVGWQQEGAGYAMYIGPGTHQGVTTVPVFRMYHEGIRQHFWTTDANEVVVLVATGAWAYEGIPGYVLPTATSDSIPVYRLNLPSFALHLWTTDANENLVLSTQHGWIAEGVMGYVQTAESIKAATGITDANGKVLLTILGQPRSFQVAGVDGKPVKGVAVGIGLDPNVPGVGAMIISHPQDAFQPKFKLVVSATKVTDIALSEAGGALDAATTLVQLGSNADDAITFLQLVGVDKFPPLVNALSYTGIQYLGVVHSLAQSMNTITKGQAGATIAALPGGSTTTMSVDQAVAELRADNQSNKLKAMIFLGLTLVPPVGTATGTVAVCGAGIDIATNFFTQQALLNCPKLGNTTEVTKVTFLGKSIYACSQAPVAQSSVSGLFRFSTTDPKSGGSLHLISKGSFGTAFEGVIGTNGTVSYSIPAGDYDAVAIAPFGSTSSTIYSTLTIPVGGGERNVPPRTCNSAEYNANYTACLATRDAENAVCDATYNFVTQTGLWAACYSAASNRFLTCLDKCSVPH